MFDRMFFTQALDGLRDAYKADTKAEAPAVELMLRGGLTLLVDDDLKAEEHYLVVNYRQRSQDRRAVIPYDNIVAVAFAPENPEHKSKGNLGFRP